MLEKQHLGSQFCDENDPARPSFHRHCVQKQMIVDARAAEAAVTAAFH